MKADITIFTTQDAKSRKPNNIKLQTTGDFEFDGSQYIIKFDESSLTNYENITTTVTCDENKMTAVRDGVLADTCLIFEKGERKLCQYSTPYGNMLVGITAKSYRFAMTDRGGHIFVTYVMDVNNNVISENIYRLSVTLCERNENKQDD